MSSTIVYVAFSAKEFVKASLIKSKGTAHGIDTWQAYEGLFSQALNGGMRGELSFTSAKHESIRQVLNPDTKESELTHAGKAFRKIAGKALDLCKATGKPKDQDSHDVALLEIAAMWSGCFHDSAPRKQPSERVDWKQRALNAESELVLCNEKCLALEIALAKAQSTVTA